MPWMTVSNGLIRERVVWWTWRAPLDWKRRDIRCGQHSGIPACCIAFFIEDWPRINSATPTPYTEALELADPGYIACPTCLERGSFVKPLRRCRCLDREH
jgi:hypothetical protein